MNNVKAYLVNGKSYTEDEVIVIHAMWQGIQDRDNIKECIELALAMVGDDKVSEYCPQQRAKCYRVVLACPSRMGCMAG